MSVASKIDRIVGWVAPRFALRRARELRLIGGVEADPDLARRLDRVAADRRLGELSPITSAPVGGWMRRLRR